MASAKFLLEHFYYGQIVSHGKPDGNPRLLAASPGVSPELAALAVERVVLPPLIRAHKGAWALVRGRDKQIPFLLIQSQQGGAGQTISHYIFAQPDALRAMGGNLKALSAVVQDQLPIFEKAGAAVPLLELPQGEPPTIEAQIDDLLDLMTYTANKTSIIESLLAAIVQGVQLIIQGAPDDLNMRVSFIEGLLALLPPSARFGVTFTTHSLPTTEIDTQIRFYSDDAAPTGTVIYNWADARVTGEEISDDYSRFIISQLRLDAELVSKQTAALTHIAGWRLNRGDKLAEALGYASSRTRIDEALLNAQPVSKDEVGKILAEDPTLTEELRVTYADHLMKFSLAMREMSHAEPVAMLLRANPALEQSVLKQMEDALNEGQSDLVYDTLAQWMSNPLGPEGTAWVDLTHRALLAQLRDLIKERDTDEINTLLVKMQDTGAEVGLGRVFAQIISLAFPLNEPTINENLFLLAVKTLSPEDFKKLMDARTFREQLPLPVRRAYGYVSGEETGAPPAGILMNIASEFGERWESLILMRFAEIARQNERIDLLDAAVLRGLAQYATTPDGNVNAAQILRLANAFDESALFKLQNPGAFYLLQIRLALSEYEELAYQMLKQSSLLYRGDKQGEYLKVVERLFTETSLASADVPTALMGINSAGVKSVPYIIASISALKGKPASPDLDSVAEKTAQILFADRQLLEVVPPTEVLTLLSYHVRQEDVVGTIRAAAVVPLSAAYQGTNGIKMMSQMYKQMDWSDKTRTAGLQMLRAFVREAEDEEARKAVVYFGKELGAVVGRALETTYAFRGLMGGTNILAFAERIHLAAGFLQDTATLYVTDPRNHPTTGALSNALDDLPGSMSVEDRKVISKALITLIKAVVVLGRQYRANRPRDENKFINRLLTGEADPRSSLDVFKAMGGYFARGRRFDVSLTGAPSSDLFNGRSGEEMRDSILAAATLLEDTVRTVAPSNAPTLLTAEIRAEVESQWSEIDTEKQRLFVRNLATDLQRIVDITAYLEANGDASIVEDSSVLSKRINGGRQRPKSTLEMYRFVAAYYRARS